MIITGVEFEPVELEYIIDTIEFLATKEQQTFLRCGYEFAITKKEFPALKKLSLYVYVRMIEETTDCLPPDIGVKLHQDVDKLRLMLCNHLGQEVSHNMDCDFYDKLRDRLTI